MNHDGSTDELLTLLFSQNAQNCKSRISVRWTWQTRIRRTVEGLWHLLDEPLILLLVFWTAKVRCPGMADCELVELQHVHDADLSYSAAEQLRPLVHTRRWKKQKQKQFDISIVAAAGKYLNEYNSQALLYTPTSRPPLEPPFIVSLEGDVYPSLMRYSAAHWKSVKQFCLLANMPAKEKNTKYLKEQIRNLSIIDLFFLW